MDDPTITDLVRADIYHALDLPAALVPRMMATSQRQHDKGLRKYGKPLKVDTPVDVGAYATEEACDLATYLRCKARQSTGADYRRVMDLYWTALRLWRDVELVCMKEERDG